MGQSMQRPRSTPRSANSRFSARSLQRSSQPSIQDRRTSMSANKLPEVQKHGSIEPQTSPQPSRMQKGELLSAAKCEDDSLGIRESNKLKVQRGSLGGQTSPLSPNFREIADCGAEYGLAHWGAANHSKQSPEASHNDAHHDITISFSKTKNINNNLFHEENSERKSTLNQILEDNEESQHQKNMHTAEMLLDDCGTRYLDTEIDRIAGTHSMYSENFNKNTSPANSPPQQGTPKKLRTDNKPQQDPSVAREANQHQKKLQNSKTMTESMTLEQAQYNDYDCTDFRKARETEARPRKTVKMSKRMQELKQKIASRASNSKDKEEILKGSIQRLSRSLRKNNSLDYASREESRNKLKPVLSKVQCLDIKIQSKVEVRLLEGSKKEEKMKASKSPRQSIIEEKRPRKEEPNPKDIYFAKIRSSEQLGKTTISSQHSNKQHKTHKNIPTQQPAAKKNQYVLQNLSPQQDISGSARKQQTVKKQPSFTEMVKKDHFSNRLKKKGQEKQIQASLQYSQVQQGVSSPVSEQLFASTCQGNRPISGQEYQFLDLRESRKPKEESRVIKQQINSLKLITQQLTSKERNPKAALQSSHSSSRQQSRNRTCQEKSSELPNLTALNYTEIIGNCDEYMLREALNRQREGQQWVREQKKRHKSSEHSSKVGGVKSRLLVF